MHGNLYLAFRCIVLYAYLIQYRLHQSFWYLKNTDMTITEIAQVVGFSGSSYYAESFRKWCGKSPSEYRKPDREGIMI